MNEMNFPKDLLVKIDDKKIYIWGAWLVGKLLEQLLNSKGIGVVGYFDGKAKTDEFNGKPIVNQSVLSDIANDKDSVILVAIREHATIRRILKEAGFIDGINMFYLGTSVGVCSSALHYEDIYGNEMNTGSILARFEIGMFGRIIVGKNVTVGENTKLIAWGGSTLEIGDNVKIGDNCLIEARDCSSIIISSGCKIENSVIIRDVNESQICFGEKNLISKGNDFYCNNSKIKIGDYNSFNQGVNARFFNNSSLVIGNNCAISYQVKMRGENGHTIIDLENKIARPSKKQISIANHVWLGMGVSLLGGTTIGENSIVGADSFVSKEFGCNVMIAGSPAKVIRENVTWDDAPDLTYEEWQQKQGN